MSVSAVSKSQIGDLFSRSRTWRGIFFVTILLRTYFSISNSYIHPDEHFQGPEAVADKVFGWATQKSWEFTSDHPARSYLSLWTVYGIPMSFLEAIFAETRGPGLDPLTIFYALRIIFALGTWVLCDMAIDRLSNTKQDRIKGLLFVASSYVTWTFQSHTFSNSLETVLLLWCLVIIYEFKHSRSTPLGRHFDSGLLGFLMMFGVFNRITFPAYLVIPSFWLLDHFKKYPLTLLTFCIAAAVTATGAVSLDTVLYGKDSYVIAPLNSVLYNMDTSNLSVHGLHSRLHHITVNLPELLGPGMVFLFSKKYIKTLPFLSAVSGILILSLIPHQEARFLIPAIPLLCWSFDTSRFPPKLLKVLLVLWFVFNLVMGVIMGTFHQGGVVASQSYIGKNLVKGANTVVWWKTYSPPIWLLGKPSNTVDVVSPLPQGTDDSERYEPVYAYLQSDYYKSRESLNSNSTATVTIVDLMGADTDILKDTLDSVSHVSSTSTTLRRAFLVSPIAAFDNNPTLKSLEAKSSIKTNTKSGTYRLTKIWSTMSHLSLESVDASNFSTLKPGLAIWEIQTL
ncbi:hypothetical protein TRICI_006509 [Trichomonascus ciferrii]|uniref:Mannosyltransferase n=1 Tax=Trichomonascus ciferrii TaxID=44093 RepID=A0A6A1LNL8_9ASCO|nr:hypothetical protein TRICI_006509 [Trichomonascus ciferrii]